MDKDLPMVEPHWIERCSHDIESSVFWNMRLSIRRDYSNNHCSGQTW